MALMTDLEPEDMFLFFDDEDGREDVFVVCKIEDAAIGAVHVGWIQEGCLCNDPERTLTPVVADPELEVTQVYLKRTEDGRVLVVKH